MIENSGNTLLRTPGYVSDELPGFLQILKSILRTRGHNISFGDIKDRFSTHVNKILDIYTDLSLNNKINTELNHNGYAVLSALQLKTMQAKTGIQELPIDQLEYMYYFLQSYQQKEVEEVNYNISNIIDICCHVVGDKNRKKKISFKKQVNTKRNMTKGFPGYACVLLYNILMNAIVHGESDEILIEIQAEEGNICLYVADNGKGIDESIFPNLNDIFERGVSGGGSTGIGLPGSHYKNIHLSADNYGLPSIHKGNKKGARIKIQFDARNQLIL